MMRKLIFKKIKSTNLRRNNKKMISDVTTFYLLAVRVEVPSRDEIEEKLAEAFKSFVSLEQQIEADGKSVIQLYQAVFDSCVSYNRLKELLPELLIFTCEELMED